MNLRRTKLVMNDFAKYVIQQSRSNLSRDKKNVTKALYNSLDSQILQDQKGLELIFEMLEYGTIKIKVFLVQRKNIIPLLNTQINILILVHWTGGL